MRQGKKNNHHRNNSHATNHNDERNFDFDQPTNKKWTHHDLKSIRPLTENQNRLFEAFADDANVLITGSAGSGKTFLSVYLSCLDLFSPETKYEKLVIVRSAVAVRSQGFLPGTLEEKQTVFEAPYTDIFNSLFKYHNTYNHMKKAGIVEFMTTSYLRGLTWDNTIVIAEEMQNADFSEISTIMTRVGRYSKVILTGDTKQNDLDRTREKSGLEKAQRVIEHMPNRFEHINFTTDDIVRSGFVKDWVVACEHLGF